MERRIKYILSMTREEEILNKAIDYSEIEDNFMEYDDCGDVCDDRELIEKAFIQGAKWADEHPNLYNDEKYHTIKVSCLDALNEKAQKYETLLNKACEWLMKNIITTETKDIKSIIGEVNYYTKENRKVLVNDFRKAMEK